jgi:hypothetical protein
MPFQNFMRVYRKAEIVLDYNGFIEVNLLDIYIQNKEKGKKIIH